MEIKYFHCQRKGCKFYSKSVRSLVKFKGKVLCRDCRLKASKCLTSIPTLNPTDNTLHNYTKLPEGRHMPKENRVGMIRINQTLRNWADKHKNLASRQRNGSSKVIPVGLTKEENKLLWNHFSKQKLSLSQIDREIKKIKEQVIKSHIEYKQGLKLTKPTFQEEFNKLIEVKHE